MKPALQLRVNQSLSLTPQLQQAIRLLQLSRPELELELNQALESNPLLELDEPTEDGVAEGEEAYDGPAEDGTESHDEELVVVPGHAQEVDDDHDGQGGGREEEIGLPSDVGAV